MNMTTWTVLGSLLITVMFGVVVAAGFSAAPPAYGCTGFHAEKHAAPARGDSRPPIVHDHHSSLVAVRMGWAVS
jgi:hypothetical protein